MSHRSVFLVAAVPVISICLFAKNVPPPAPAKSVAGNATSGDYDGPAQLPIATVASSMADTPAPGSVISVNAGDDLKAAISKIRCGDTLQLQAGTTFTGTFRLPALGCDDSHWIILRTSSADSALPAEGRRLTPCYAGLASMVGRPQYSCPSPQNVLAKIVAGPGGAVVFQAGASHYRLIGLEVTRPIGTKGSIALILVDTGGSANHIVLDRSWLHGTTQDETRVGFKLSGTSNVAIVDSYFSDFHCTARTGSCTEAHAVSGGIGDYQDGIYKIEDNFLESASQAILFGGGAATTSPTDITIRFNHFFKPWQWMKGSSPFQGGDSGNPFIVRHHLELKNAVRVLAESNLMENVWGGFGESGGAIVLTPKSQHSKSGGNVCPSCVVTDVTIRYTHIFHASGGFEIATDISGNGKGGAPATEGTRFSIHDVVLDDINRRYLGGGRLFLVKNSWPTNPINTITIDHVTGFADSLGGVVSLSNKSSNPPMYGFVFTNNIVYTGKNPISSAGGGDTTCAHSGTPAERIANCFSTFTFTNNAIVGAPAHYQPSSWPTGNFFASDMNEVDFVQCDNGNGGNYELQASSPYKNMGTDGRDLGADIAGIKQRLAGVE